MEVQVRTVWQDRWAQIVEGLGDTWGRQIRYGELPPEPDRPLPPGVSRARVWAVILEASELIDWGERSDVEATRLDAQLSALPDMEDLEDPEAQELLHEAFEERDRQIRANQAHWVAMNQQMELLVGVLDELG